jgi:tRNA threonylcarbamoyl adenosine modification protein (Sua5/YciO/YrdC/YwlC family)
MAQYVWIHPEDPQPRLLQKAAECVAGGGVIAYPTDVGFALGCGIGLSEPMQRLRAIRRLEDKHYLTLVCRHVAELAHYAQMDNAVFRLVKRLLPGPYTLILPATREVPRKLLHPKRHTIGVRIPKHTVVQALLDKMDAPLLSTTLRLPGEEFPEQEGWQIQEKLDNQIDMVLDDGSGSEITPTTVIDCSVWPVQVLREGKGAVDIL